MKDLNKIKILNWIIDWAFDKLKINIYIEKVLKQFYMNKLHWLSISIIVWSFDINIDPFQPQKIDEELLISHKIPYLIVIGVLLYLTNKVRSNICFTISLLAKFISFPTRRHLNSIKHAFRYLWGTTNMKLFYSNNSSQKWLGMQMQDICLIYINLDFK